MKNAIIVHGKPPRAKFENPELLNPSDSNWLPWAKRKLTLAGSFAVVPDMPKPYEPVYDDWRREFERYDVTKETTLVGHSYGAGFLVRWLSERPEQEVSKLVLVAPWIDPNHNYGDLCDVKIDRSLAEGCIGGLTIFYSSLDDEQARTSAETLIAELEGAYVRDIPEYGHFMIGNSMSGPEFPELLDEVID